MFKIESRAPKPPSLAILLTCFNRREKTLESLEALRAQSTQQSRAIHIILVDDGSTDGTAAAVRERFPDTELILGSGSLFWNGGMRLAFARAQQIGFDYYLLLNDDTVLEPDCLDTLFATSRSLAVHNITSIVAAAICDPVTRKRTYGGVRRQRRWSGVRDTFLDPDPMQPLSCDTMNGNCVLIPARVARELGNLEGVFRQQYGDFDYGFRARRAGFSVYLAPAYLGTCANNPTSGTWRDTKADFRTRWKHLMSPKGVPPAEWFLFARRHCGYLWPLYFASPYCKVWLSRFRQTSRQAHGAEGTP